MQGVDQLDFIVELHGFAQEVILAALSTEDSDRTEEKSRAIQCLFRLVGLPIYDDEVWMRDVVEKCYP